MTKVKTIMGSRRIGSASRSNPIALYLSFSLCWAIAVGNVFKSSWAGDDWPNSQSPYWILWRSGSLTPKNIWTEAMYWNDQWMRGQGRFYPLQWLESRFAFSYFRELWQYKLFESSILFLTGILFILLVFKVSRSHSLALLTLMFLTVTMQFRRDFDPHIGFAFLVPSLMIKVFVASLFAFQSAATKKSARAIPYSVAGGIFFFAAMSTYEYAFLLFPVLAISFLAGVHQSRVIPNEIPNRVPTLFQRDYLLALPLLASWLSYGIFVFGYLRAHATSISGNYVLGISFQSIPTFISQIFTPWPLITFLKKQDLPTLNLSHAIVVALIVAIIGTYFLTRLFGSVVVKEKFGRSPEIQGRLFLWISIGVMSLDLILSPGFMLSIQKAWWHHTSPTHGYLGVLIQEFGSALALAVFASLWLGGSNLKKSRQKTPKGRSKP